MITVNFGGKFEGNWGISLGENITWENITWENITWESLGEYHLGNWGKFGGKIEVRDDRY